MDGKLVVGVDLGSTNIKGVIGSRNENGKVSILAVHTQVSSGVEKGMIVDVTALRECFYLFMRELLNKAGLLQVVVTKFYVFNSYRKMRSVTTDVEKVFEEKEVTQALLDEMQNESYENPTSNSYENLESVLQAYIVNNVATLSPLGQTTTRLKARYTLIVGNEDGKNNLRRALLVGNKNVAENACTNFLSFASLGEVVLTKKERVTGTLLIDFGGETTTVAFYSQMSLRNLYIFDFGGCNITRKLMEELSIPQKEAELLKVKCGVKPRQGVLSLMINGEKVVIDLQKVSECINREVDSQLSEVEVFCRDNNIIAKCQKVVIVGGGAKCIGLSEKLETMFEKNVIGGYPICLNENLSKLDKKTCQQYLDYSKLCAILNKEDDNCIEELTDPTNKKPKGKGLNILDTAIKTIWGKTK